VAEPHGRDAAHRKRAWESGAHVPPSNFQTGMPHFLALSVIFTEMPEPGNIGLNAASHSAEPVQIPITRRPRSASWRARWPEWCGLGVAGPNGPEGAIWVILRAATVRHYHVGMLGVSLVESVPDGAMVIEVETAREGDLGAGWQQQLGLAAALGGGGSRGCRSSPP
jgi:hypothetical protein